MPNATHKMIILEKHPFPSTEVQADLSNGDIWGYFFHSRVCSIRIGLSYICPEYKEESDTEDRGQIG